VLVGEYRLNPPGESEDPAYLGNVTNADVDPGDVTDDGLPVYPIGRYSWVDTDVVNDEIYFYAITAFGFLPGETGPIEVAGSPSTSTDRAVVPNDSPHPVRFLSFTANRAETRALIRWSLSGIDRAAFHVHREEPGAPRVRLTDGLLNGRTEYTFTDLAPPAGRAAYWLEQVRQTGEVTWLGPAALSELAPASAVLTVGPAMPNPSRGAIRLNYTLPDARPVHIAVFDLRGRRVAVLNDDVQGPGEHSVVWNGRDASGRRAAAGLYTLQLRAGGEAMSQRVVLID
jgi:hypothetical protein